MGKSMNEAINIIREMISDMLLYFSLKVCPDKDFKCKLKEGHTI